MLPLLYFFIPPVILLAASGLILLASRQMAKPERRFFGTASKARACLEVGLLNLAVALPVMVVDGLILFKAGSLVTALKVWGAYASLATVIAIAFSPLWMALRLTRPVTTPTFLAYVRVTGGFFLVLLLTLLFNYTLLSLPIRLLQEPPVSFGSYSEVLFMPLAQAIWASLLFVAMRGALELLLSQPSPPEASQPIPKVSRDPTHFYSLIAYASILALGLWAGSFVLYSLFPEATYIPPMYQAQAAAGVPFEIPMPLEQPLPVTIAMAIPQLCLLLLSLGLAIFVRPAEPAARLFTLLCLLNGVHGLQIFPASGGVFFYSLALLARIFVMPVQIHFALLFPRQALTIGLSAHRSRRWVLIALYTVTGLLTPFWLYFWLHVGELTVQTNEVFALMEAGVEAGDPTLLQGLVGVFFWGLIVALFGLMTALFWLMSGFILFRTWRRLNRVQLLIESPQAAEPEQRQSIKRRLRSLLAEQPTEAELSSSEPVLELIARAKQQLKWVRVIE